MKIEELSEVIRGGDKEVDNLVKKLEVKNQIISANSMKIEELSEVIHGKNETLKKLKIKLFDREEEIEKIKAFNDAFRYLRLRISYLLATPIKRLDKLALRDRLREIGELEGASHGHKADA